MMQRKNEKGGERGVGKQSSVYNPIIIASSESDDDDKLLYFFLFVCFYISPISYHSVHSLDCFGFLILLPLSPSSYTDVLPFTLLSRRNITSIYTPSLFMVSPISIARQQLYLFTHTHFIDVNLAVRFNWKGKSHFFVPLFFSLLYSLVCPFNSPPPPALKNEHNRHTTSSIFFCICCAGSIQRQVILGPCVWPSNQTSFGMQKIEQQQQQTL